jgi:cobalt-zinc-cadmium efflux system protein
MHLDAGTLHSTHRHDPAHGHGQHAHGPAASNGHGGLGHACHGHGMTPDRLDRAMLIGVGLNAGFVVAELLAGWWAGSLALLADAGHNAGDVVGLLLAWGASWLARRPPTERFTRGLRRATIFAAFTNATLLLAACGAIIWEAIGRFQDAAPVAGFTVVVVAAIGVVINTFTALLFLRGHGDANIRGAFLHMAADAAVSAGVVAAGLVIMATGLGWVDPLVSIVIAAVIVVATWGLFRESVELALDAVPRGVVLAEISGALAALPDVRGVHELRVWAASTSETSLTVHLHVADAADRDRLLAAARDLLAGRFGVTDATIQIEGEPDG